VNFLGFGVDPARNEASGDRDISSPGIPGEVLVVAAREDLQIAAEVRRIVANEET
jgi:acetate kinase